MSGALVIARRELVSLFFSPLAWILLVVASLINGSFFYLYVVSSGGDVTMTLDLLLGGGWPFWSFIVFLPPLLAMRMISEEASTGTLEFLLTAPVTDAGVVVGKFLAATAFMSLLWLVVPVYALIVQTTGGVTPDWGGVFGGYLGAVLSSGLFVAIGLLASSLTTTPLLAAFFAFVACLSWLVLPMLAELVLSNVRVLFVRWAGSVELAERWVRAALDKMNVVSHFQGSFLHGVFDSAEIVFFLTWTAFFLFLAVRSLEARRWRA